MSGDPLLLHPSIPAPRHFRSRLTTIQPAALSRLARSRALPKFYRGSAHSCASSSDNHHASRNHTRMLEIDVKNSLIPLLCLITPNTTFGCRIKPPEIETSQ